MKPTDRMLNTLVHWLVVGVLVLFIINVIVACSRGEYTAISDALLVCTVFVIVTAWARGKM